MNSVKSSENNLKMSYGQQVQEIVEEITDFENNQEIKDYWSELIEILKEAEQPAERRRILRNLYSV